MFKTKVDALKEYLKTNGINLAFQAIFSEIVSKKIEKEQVFAYTAMRLRQIGNDLNAMKKVSLWKKQSNNSNFRKKLKFRYHKYGVEINNKHKNLDVQNIKLHNIHFFFILFSLRILWFDFIIQKNIKFNVINQY